MEYTVELDKKKIIEYDTFQDGFKKNMIKKSILFQNPKHTYYHVTWTY